jgi:MFS family permease
VFEAFAERDYRTFWSFQFLSNIGSWMQAVAQGWLVYRLTDSAFLLGFVGFANSAPSIVLMLPGGVLADQFDRKRVVALSQGAQALSALFLAISIRMDRITVWQIIAAATVVGIAQSFSAMNSLQFNLSRAIGPLIAGATLSAFGSFWCFFLNALSFLPVIVILGRIRDRQERTPGAVDMLTKLREGFAYVRGDRVVMILLGIVAATSLFGYPYMQLIPVLARARFVNDAAGTGYLMAAIGAGALLGALLLSTVKLQHARMVSIITGSVCVFGVALAISAFLGRAGAMVLLALCGFSGVTSVALCNTMIQHRVTDAMRGRVLSMYTFAFFAFIPFGNLLAGAVAERWGIVVTLCGLGVALAVAGVMLRPGESKA